MKLLVVILCLLSERYLMHSFTYQRFNWFPDYAQRMEKRFVNHKQLQNPWLLLASLITPVVFIAFIIYVLFHAILFGLLGLVFSLLVFAYCLGPNNVFYPLSNGEDANTNEEVANYLSRANRELFSVVFWYIIAGPIALLAYRLFTLCINLPSVKKEAEIITDYLEWVPARLTSILYLLVGHFQQGLGAFRQYAVAKPEQNHTLVGECGVKALLANDRETIPLPVAETLVEHATVLLLVIIALITLAAWL